MTRFFKFVISETTAFWFRVFFGILRYCLVDWRRLRRRCSGWGYWKRYWQVFFFTFPGVLLSPFLNSDRQYSRKGTFTIGKDNFNPVRALHFTSSVSREFISDSPLVRPPPLFCQIFKNKKKFYKGSKQKWKIVMSTPPSLWNFLGSGGLTNKFPWYEILEI